MNLWWFQLWCLFVNPWWCQFMVECLDMKVEWYRPTNVFWCQFIAFEYMPIVELFQFLRMNEVEFLCMKVAFLFMKTPFLNAVLFLFMNMGRFWPTNLEPFLFMKAGLALFMNGGLFLFMKGEPLRFMSEGRGAMRSPIITPTNPAITTSVSTTATNFLSMQRSKCNDGLA